MSFSFSHGTRSLRIAAIAALFLAAPFCNAAHAQQWGRWGITVFPSLPAGFTFGGGHAINNAGLVVGNYLGVASIFDPASNTITNMFSSPGRSDGLAINNNGVGAGTIYGALAAPAATASAGTTTTLPLLSDGNYAAPYAINDGGVVVGIATIDLFSGIGHPFLFDGTMHDLAALFPDAAGSAFDVNNAGVATGYLTDDGGNEHPAVFDQTGVHFLGGSGEAQAINDRGNVVGYILEQVGAYSSADAFFYDALGTHDLGRSGHDLSGAFDIDEANDVVGYFVDFSIGSYGVLWEPTGGAFTSYLLADIVNSREGTTGWTFRDTRSISDDGRFIVADGCFQDPAGGAKSCGTFVLEANAPEPSTIVLTATGLLAVVGVVRRTRRGASRILSSEC